MWIIKHIFDGDYGCEERSYDIREPMVSVTLVNEAGEEKRELVADSWLIENHLDDGMEWPDFSKLILETKDLILKKAVQGDWLEMFENIWKHEESAKYMSWSVTTSGDEAFERMQRTIAFQKQHKYTFLIFEKDSNRPIGFAGMREKNPEVYEETGIAIGPKFVGKGYGTQCLLALMEEAKKCGAKKFEACCRTQNIASHSLQMRLGFATTHFEDRIDERTGQPFVMEMNEKILI